MCQDKCQSLAYLTTKEHKERVKITLLKRLLFCDVQSIEVEVKDLILICCKRSSSRSRVGCLLDHSRHTERDSSPSIYAFHRPNNNTEFKYPFHPKSYEIFTRSTLMIYSAGRFQHQ